MTQRDVMGRDVEGVQDGKTVCSMVDSHWMWQNQYNIKVKKKLKNMVKTRITSHMFPFHFQYICVLKQAFNIIII